MSQENAVNVRVAECLDMAMKARRKAASGLSPADERFWRRMEERWLHLAQTYRETEKLMVPAHHGYPVDWVASCRDLVRHAQAVQHFHRSGLQAVSSRGLREFIDFVNDSGCDIAALKLAGQRQADRTSANDQNIGGRGVR